MFDNKKNNRGLIINNWNINKTFMSAVIINKLASIQKNLIFIFMLFTYSHADFPSSRVSVFSLRLLCGDKD